MPARHKPSEQLAVIIVCYKSSGVIAACVAALDAAVDALPRAPAIRTSVILVANSFGEGLETVTSSACTVEVVQLSENVGFAPAVNAGLAVVPTADWVLLLNPDARVELGCVATLLDTARRENAALAGPLLCDASGAPSGVSERPFHSIRRELATQFLGRTRRRPPYGRRAYRDGDARCLTGACLLASGPFLRSVGGLDVEVRMYLEDVLLCKQAHQHGERVMFVPTARCLHQPGQSAGGDNFDSSLGLHLTLLAARVAFIRRSSGHVNELVLRGLIAAGAAARAVVTSGTARRRHVGVLRWAITSGRAPIWTNGPVEW